VDKAGNAVETVAQAIAELRRLQTHRADDTLRHIGQTPKLADYVLTYLQTISAGEGSKAPGTVEKEKTILARWVESFGQLRLDQIKPVHIHRFTTARRSEKNGDGTPKICNRTINLDVIGLRCLFKQARHEGLIQRLPMEGIKPLDESETERPLFTVSDLEKLCSAAFGTKTNKEGVEVPLTENAHQFVDYVRLMAYCGTRRNETLGIQWKDVDFEREQLHVRRQVTSRGIETCKNGEARTVDFNGKLKSHLLDMQKRKANSEWLFPSPQRGDKDIPAKSFRESLDMVRTKAGMPNFGFHDLRHHFISMCVMSGIDFMTIAAWAGHKDGGVLIGKVYGHLANEHRKAMAEKLQFQPTVLPQAVAC
jgi:integrase